MTKKITNLTVNEKIRVTSKLVDMTGTTPVVVVNRGGLYNFNKGVLLFVKLDMDLAKTNNRLGEGFFDIIGDLNLDIKDIRLLNGNWNEWQRLEWKFRISKDFRPSTSFCHLHQLKAQEGNNGAPLITISTRCDKDGNNKRVQIIHTGDNKKSSKGVIIDNLPLSDFEEE